MQDTNRTDEDHGQECQYDQDLRSLSKLEDGTSNRLRVNLDQPEKRIFAKESYQVDEVTPLKNNIEPSESKLFKERDDTATEIDQVNIHSLHVSDDQV
jgi:hypothetical protein